MRRAAGMMALILTGLSASPVLAEPTISTDRPSFSAAAAVVPDGKVQLETGGTVEVSPDVVFVLPQFLFRIAVVESLELRLGLPSVVIGGDQNILGTTSVEFKFAEAVSDTIRLGALPYINLPSSDDTLFGQATLGARGLMDIALGDTFGATVNLDLAMTQKEESRREIRFMSSLLLSAGFAEQWSGFVEAFTIYQPSLNDPQLGVDGGVAFLPTRYMQLDLSVGAGFGDALPDAVVSLGFSLMGP